MFPKNDFELLNVFQKRVKRREETASRFAIGIERRDRFAVGIERRDRFAVGIERRDRFAVGIENRDCCALGRGIGIASLQESGDRMASLEYGGA